MMEATAHVPDSAERLHQATFLLVQLESGGSSDAGPLATLLQELATDDAFPAPVAQLLRAAADRFASALARDEGDFGSALPEVGRLVEEAADVLEDGVEESPTTDASSADPEMLETFLLESLDFLAEGERAALALDADPSHPEAVNTLFRCFHTLKGTAGFLDLPHVVTLGHRAESLLSLIRDVDRDPEPGEIDLIFRSVDTLTRMVSAIGAADGGDDVAWRDLADQLTRATADGAGARPDDRTPGVHPAPAAPSAPSVDDAQQAASTSGWTRVRTDQLDRVIDALGELTVAQSILAQDPAITGAVHSELAQKAWSATRIVSDLQKLALSMRTVPLAGLFRKMARLVRELSRARDATIHFEVEGEHTEIDRNMVDLLSDPLVHMIRNAVDHGIEAAEDRGAAGKPEAGTLRLRAMNAGGEVVLELSDDGGGIDRGRVRQRAVERGLIEADVELSDADLFQLIFVPGFSTTDEVTDLSGRGVGMDVVRSNVESLHGQVEVRSEPGAGSAFTIRVPLTLAISNVLVARVGDERFVVPSRDVVLSYRPDAAGLGSSDGAEFALVQEEPVPIVRLHSLLGVPGAETDPTAGVLVVVGTGRRRRALLVDDLLGQMQVVSKPLGPLLDETPWIAGGAVMGDGAVALILDVPALLATAAPELAELDPALRVGQ